LIVSPTLAMIIIASVIKPAVYPIVPEKVSRMTAKETPTWPFDAGIVRRLLVSILTPGLVYLVKILSQTGIRFGS